MNIVLDFRDYVLSHFLIPNASRSIPAITLGGLMTTIFIAYSPFLKAKFSVLLTIHYIRLQKMCYRFDFLCSHSFMSFAFSNILT